MDQFIAKVRSVHPEFVPSPSTDLKIRAHTVEKNNLKAGQHIAYVDIADDKVHHVIYVSNPRGWVVSGEFVGDRMPAFASDHELYRIEYFPVAGRKIKLNHSALLAGRWSQGKANDADKAAWNPWGDGSDAELLSAIYCATVGLDPHAIRADVVREFTDARKVRGAGGAMAYFLGKAADEVANKMKEDKDS